MSQLPGEFELIEQITSDLEFGPNVLLGPGDDAAVFTVTGPVAWSTDSLVEDVHFRRDWSAAFDVGRKSIAVSVADIEAMGAKPVGVLVGLSIPPDLDAEWVRDFTSGLKTECATAGVNLLGGDLTRSRDITINVSVIGDLEGRTPLTRAGAQPGQVIAVVGNLGMAAAGYAVLNRGFRSPRDVVLAHRCPSPPYGQGVVAARSASALIDISDGLIADLGHIADASQVTLAIDTSKLAVSAPQQAVAAALGRVDPVEFQLTGGEDHALAGCFPSDAVPEGWRVIGEVQSGSPQVLIDGENLETVGGWRHF